MSFSKQQWSGRNPAVVRASSARASRLVEELEIRTLMAAPVIEAIGGQTIPGTKSIYVPLRATDADNDPVTYTLGSSNPNVTATLLTGNPYLEMDVTGFGTLTFQLFADTTPVTVRKISDLVRANYYDGLTFHRIADLDSNGSFIFQGGSAAGNGQATADELAFQFDDEFSPNSIFSGSGQLAMAKSDDDTNSSQFFVTARQPRFLDFQHTIFGQLVRGFDLLTAMQAAPLSGTTPTPPIVISDARIVQNNHDGVLRLSGPAGEVSTITVTASDGTGSNNVQFLATGVVDATNNSPILGPFSDTIAPAGTPFTINLTSTDIDGGSASQYAAAILSGNATINADQSGILPGSQLIVTPGVGFTGAVEVLIGVTGGNDFDKQTITIGFGDAALTGTPFTFRAADATAASNVAVARFSSADPSDVAGNFTARVNWGDGKTGSSVTNGTIISDGVGGFLVLASHVYDNVGTWNVAVTVTGNLGARTVINSTAVVLPRVSLVGGILTVHATGGNDILSAGFSGSSVVVRVNDAYSPFDRSLVTGIVVNAYEGADLFSTDAFLDIPLTVLGGLGADTITGGNAGDSLGGGKGNDVVNGNFGPDTIVGGLGNDRLGGGKGFDNLNGGEGNDTLIGGLGVDTLGATDGNDTIFARDGFADLVRGGVGLDSAQVDTGSIVDDVLGVETFLV